MWERSKIQTKKYVTEQAMQRNAAIKQTANLFKGTRVSKTRALRSICIEMETSLSSKHIFVQRSSDVAGYSVGPCANLRLT